MSVCDVLWFLLYFFRYNNGEAADTGFSRIYRYSGTNSSSIRCILSLIISEKKISPLLPLYYSINSARDESFSTSYLGRGGNKQARTHARTSLDGVCCMQQTAPPLSRVFVLCLAAWGVRVSLGQEDVLQGRAMKMSPPGVLHVISQSGRTNYSLTGCIFVSQVFVFSSFRQCFAHPPRRRGPNPTRAAACFLQGFARAHGQLRFLVASRSLSVGASIKSARMCKLHAGSACMCHIYSSLDCGPATNHIL